MASLGTSTVQNDPAEYRKQAKALAEIEPLVEELARGSDADMRVLAEEELGGLATKREQLIDELKVLLLPKDPNDDKNVIVEIRAGTGGEEAALFAGDLYRMYSRYAERHGWKLDILNMSEAG